MQVPTWQPIETAPKDGTKIVLLCDLWQGRTPIVAHWDENGATYEGPMGRFTWHTSMDGDTVAERVPTHWLPIPEPPS